DLSGKSLGYSCTACHSASVPHGFAVQNSTNFLRFNMPVNQTIVSSLRQEAPFSNAFSICGNCHQAKDDVPAHGYSATQFGQAGCNDCHEPHGVNVSYAGVSNKIMLRRFIPKSNTAGANRYGINATSGTWELIAASTTTSYYYDASGTGACDNAECHQGVVVNNVSIYPLTGYVNSTQHSGQAQATGSDCLSCHTHTDSTGSMGAQDSCTTCHGQPPTSLATAASGYTQDEAKTPHRRHASSTTAGGLGMNCEECHYDYVVANTTTHNSTLAGFTPQSVRFQNYTSATYNKTTNTCQSLYCHSNGKGTFTNPTWGTTPDWSTNDLTCRSCHAGIDAGTNITTYAHDSHINSGITCEYCHYTTVTAVTNDAGTTINSTNHINGSINVAASGAGKKFNGVNVAFNYTVGSYTCGSLSCHGTSGISWTTASTSVTCESCHGTTGADVNNWNGTDGVISLLNSANYSAFGHGAAANGARTCNDPTTGCHDKTVGHDFTMAGANPFRLRDLNGT
ncbi:MAG: CxxxxCH/CxxCH domain-containing protein, partial [Actinobacteria bacterium]